MFFPRRLGMRTLKGVCLESKEYGEFNWSLRCLMATATLLYFCYFLGCFLWQCMKYVLSVSLFVIFHQHLSILIFSVNIENLGISLLFSLKPMFLKVCVSNHMWESAGYKMQILQSHLSLLNPSTVRTRILQDFSTSSSMIFMHTEKHCFSHSQNELKAM